MADNHSDASPLDAPGPAVPAEHLIAVLRAEGDRIAATSPGALALPVPTISGWTVENVVRHTAKVHSWVLAALRLPASAPMPDPSAMPVMPRGEACIEAYRDAVTQLADDLARRDPDQPTTTFLGPRAVAWWARRQAHEATIHRFDIAYALNAAGGGSPDDADPVAAADGIDEWCQVMIPRAIAKGSTVCADLDGRSVHIHGTDTDRAEWMIRFADGQAAATYEHAKGDVALRGRAQDLLLALWRRDSLDKLAIHGDRAAAEILTAGIRV
ncbi:maleylpyruvate isomerase N-terminal domain-containing protein [Hoyosella sp. G463]|uniref:Maleylpyruvate isomerase N-terminal domain-containing protein n=1 Tax=Lolliginicoccus lacisalsi TaxID=2742202 RepID=A0A927JAS6_9ACTN|nr:maleylpyruvate isomerase N-terminal domain-containing protein [Lolliginicoccus lacisalsi]MBD8504987.1 maleylpyruvate isomerase N-terminal domain-containing protein [Lolliginicoccus lacisalsi]